MVGKREKKGNRPRLPGLLLLLATAAVLLTSGGPSGVAADSPMEEVRGAAVVPVEPLPEQMPALPETPLRQEGPAPWEGPVPESEPVEDTYFDDVVFLGDSRTEGFSLYSGLKTGTYFHAVGATVESVFTKAVETEQGKMPLLDAMAEVDCGKIYVMLGINELGWSRAETFHDQYARVIDRLREDHPDAEVVLQSIIPVSAKQEAKGSYVNNGRIAAYNEVIRELAEEKDCPYLDVAEAVVDEDGFLRADWNFDGVHLNVAGCQAWLEYLRTHPVDSASGTAADAGETA
nr:GDSL-type esterase/lipase family protein [uncultured Oscillibacter sp.]